MDIIKIIGIGLIALIIIILLKQYKPEFAVYVSLIAGALILMLAIDKLAGIISLLQSLANKASINTIVIDAFVIILNLLSKSTHLS